ncbi:MAG: T9SS type A sorting domain-containing protein [Ignavibacteriales bacterium]|nr:T9SS type A sorting domain-containing protein [Ignavibacteriales bacterium]
MIKYALLLILCAGVSSMVFPQHVPVTVQAAARKMSVPDATENLFERPGQKKDAAQMPVILPKQFQKNTTAAKKYSTETFKPGLVIIDDTSRVEYIYDDKGLLHITQMEVKQGANWINFRKQTNTYDPNGSQLETVFYQWHNNVWEAIYKTEYSYYPNGRVQTEQIAQQGAGGLVNMFHYTYTYDDNGNILSDLTKEWTNGSWVNYYQSTNTYDKNNNQLTSLLEVWEGEQWSAMQKFTGVYDENNNVISELYERSTNGVWSPLSRNTYSYDSFGNAELKLREVYVTGVWTNVSQYIYTYDMPSKKMTGLAQVWSGSAWENEWRYEAEYNDNEDLVAYTSEIWQGANWGEKYIRSIIYNVNGNVETDLEQGTIDNTLQNKSKREYKYDVFGNAVMGNSYVFREGAWIPAEGALDLSYNNRENYLSDMATVITIQYTAITGTEKPVERINTFSLEQNFPNPFNPETVIRYNIPEGGHVKLQVFDILGNAVATLVNGSQAAGTHSVRFNGSQLTSGIYICRIEAGNFTSVKKMSLLK